MTTKSHETRTYAVDVRIFLAIISTSMIVAFGIGVMLGPTPQLIPTDLDRSHAYNNVVEKKVVNTPRERAKHSNEIGKKISDLNEHHVNFQKPILEDFGDGKGPIEYNATIDNSSESEEHLPAGQHLLMDIMNVEAEFLNSETRLAEAMVTCVRGAGLTMLSYHCHSLLPAGVSCVGVLLESHISFHTWPVEGVITLDLFTCGPKPLLPVVQDLERLFGIPRNKPNSDEKEVVESQWSHELRGFRDSDSANTYLSNKSDLAIWVVSPLIFGIKEQIISVTTEHQRIDIWDFLSKDQTPSHDDAMRHGLKEGDPRWYTSDIATPERYLFLDGKIQSMRDTEKEYHESLVHPTMFSHPNPKHVAVVGGGGGATLREFLKHETVETITMIEIDEIVIEVSRKYLAHMSDCSDLIGLADSCFDDARVNVINAEASTWFKTHYGPQSINGDQPRFDVIILDSFDPRGGSELYKDLSFLDALYSSMSNDGIFSLHVGNPHTIHDPKADMGAYAPREDFFKVLENHPSTAAMMVYEEAHAGYDEPRAFLTVCKSVECRSTWYSTPAAIDDEIYDRTRRTKSKKPTLLHYDGATHHTYLAPPRAWETVYCRREPMPFECEYRGLDMNRRLIELKEDDGELNFDLIITEFDGREVTSVLARTDIPKGSYILPSDIASSATFTNEVLNALEGNVNASDDATVIRNFLTFVDENGHGSMTEGMNMKYVEVGASSFIRKTEEQSEVNVGRWIPSHPSGKNPVFSPVYDRRRSSLDVFLVATKDIKVGEELVRPTMF